MTAMWSAGGRVLRPDEPIPAACRLHRTGAAQTIAGGGATTVLDFDALMYQVGHSTTKPGYDLSANSITITQPGYYIVRGAVSIDSTGGSANYQLHIRQNGTIWSSYYIASNAGYVTLQSHKIDYFAAGDAITAAVVHDGGSSHPTLTAAGSRPSLTVILLR